MDQMAQILIGFIVNPLQGGSLSAETAGQVLAVEEAGAFIMHMLTYLKLIPYIEPLAAEVEEVPIRVSMGLVFAYT